MVLSPQIRQYLKLLQLPVAELEQAVDAELAENPVLEEKTSPKAEIEGLPDENAEPSTPDKSPSEEIRVGDSFERFSELEDSLDEGKDIPDMAAPDRGSSQKQRDFRETLITQPQLLWEFLNWQVRFLDLSEAEQKIAAEIIGAIDEEGYLKATADEIAASAGCDTAHVEKVLGLIQELDPPGIGARNLRECLLLQLKRLDPAEAAIAIRIVSDYLPLLEKRDLHALAKTLQATAEQLRNAETVISRLDPRPGLTFSGKPSPTVIPDAAITFEDEEKTDSPRLKIDIRDESIPELRISPYYRRLMRNPKTDEKTRAFIREKLQSAMDFMRALQLRKSTLREITEEIAKAQPEFFEKGFACLHPLRLKDIARNIGIHESTVSRAISGKYVSTPQGTIPYRSFFSSKLESKNGESQSQKSMMEKIRSMVEREDKNHPLSDQEIVETLQAEGVVIARRTVAKYRDLLRILPSHLRRRR